MFSWCWFQEHPLQNKKWDTCAVVGNGGILTNSTCGKRIDSAQFVIRWERCPVEWRILINRIKLISVQILNNNPYIFFVASSDATYLPWTKAMRNMWASRLTLSQQIQASSWRSERKDESLPLKMFPFCHVAWHLVFIFRYGALMGRRRPFVESLRSYGNALLLLPAFSFGFNTAVCLRAVYTIEDFERRTQTLFLNPEYLKNLALFWQSQGLRALRPSSGLIMASMALEQCANVHLYGFWPFSNHPHGLQALTNHYYDDRQPKKVFHAMPAEFELLLKLHSQGVLRLHLGDCQPGET